MKSIVIIVAGIITAIVIGFAYVGGVNAATSGANAAKVLSYNVGVCDPAYPTRCWGPASNFTNITTATNTVIKASAGTFKGLIVNTGGLSSVATVYNNTTCTGAKIGTFSTATQASIPVDAWASVGICVTTATGTPADITVLWR